MRRVVLNILLSLSHSISLSLSLELARRQLLSFPRSFLTRPEVVGDCAVSTNQRRLVGGVWSLVCVEAFFFVFIIYRVYVSRHFNAGKLSAHKKIEFLFGFFFRPAPKRFFCPSKKVRFASLFLKRQLLQCRKILNFSSLCTVCCYVLPLLCASLPSSSVQLKLRNFS